MEVLPWYPFFVSRQPQKEKWTLNSTLYFCITTLELIDSLEYNRQSYYKRK